MARYSKHQQHMASLHDAEYEIMNAIHSLGDASSDTDELVKRLKEVYDVVEQMIDRYETQHKQAEMLKIEEQAYKMEAKRNLLLNGPRYIKRHAL